MVPQKWGIHRVQYCSIGNTQKSNSLLHITYPHSIGHGWVLEIETHRDLISAIYKLYGKPAQADRVVKLYMVFDALAFAKNTGDHSLLAKRVEEIFGILVSQELLRLSVEALSFGSII